MKRAVFLDRDGVINRVVPRDGRLVSPRTLEDFSLYDFAGEAAELIKSVGFSVFVVTNQPDVARGHMSTETLESMMAQVMSLVRPDDVAICDHDDHHKCTCRKPKPGMIHALAERHDIDLSKSYLVGDSWKDMDAARAAGVETILIRRDDNRDTNGDHEVGDLMEAAELIVTRSKGD